MRAAPLLLGPLLLATSCVTKAPTAPAAAPAARAEERTDADATLELAIHDRVNAHRKSKGLEPLALDARINRLARLHSAAMATGRVKVGHHGFGERAKLLSKDGPKAVAENVAYDVGHADPVKEIVEGWLRSKDHRENIEGPYERTGVGAARSVIGELYVTQLFVDAPRRTGEGGILAGLTEPGSPSPRSGSRITPGRSREFSIRPTSRAGAAPTSGDRECYSVASMLRAICDTWISSVPP